MCVTHLPPQKASHPKRGEWDFLITGFFKSGHPIQAISAYRQSQEQDFHGLSPFTLVCLLKSCTQVKDPLLGRTLHAHIARMALLDADPFLGSALIDMYFKCGFLPHAQQVFDKLLVRNAVVWTALIAGYAKCGYGDVAIHQLEDMQNHGVCPDTVTYIAGLKACATTRALRMGQELHAAATTKGLEMELLLCSTLVDMYAKCGSLASAQRIYQTLQVPNKIAGTALIVGYTDHGLAHEALLTFQQMHGAGIPADAVLYTCSLKACGCMDAIKEIHELHSRIVKAGMEGDQLICNTLIDAYAKSGSFLDAQIVLFKGPSQNVISWNALIAGFVHHEHGVEALLCFKCMQAEGILSNDATVSCTLKACGITRNVQEGQEIHSEVSRRWLTIDVLVGNALIDMYSKCGLLAKAKEVFERLPVHDVVSWTALIAAYSEIGRFEQALYAFYQMRQAGIAPDVASYVCTIKVCTSLVALDIGQEIHAEMIEKTMKLDSMVGSSLVNMYAQCGWLEKANEVFETLRFRNVPLCNSLLAGYAHLGDVMRVVCILGTMIENKLLFNAASFTSLFNALSHAGFLYDTLLLLESMSKNFCTVPTLTHYNCIVDLLCRAGAVDLAVAFISMMPFHPHAVVWHGVLAACQRIKNTKLFLQAFNHSIELNENNHVVYFNMLKVA